MWSNSHASAASGCAAPHDSTLLLFLVHVLSIVIHLIRNVSCFLVLRSDLHAGLVDGRKYSQW